MDVGEPGAPMHNYAQTIPPSSKKSGGERREVRGEERRRGDGGERKDGGWKKKERELAYPCEIPAPHTWFPFHPLHNPHRQMTSFSLQTCRNRLRKTGGFLEVT